MNFFIFLVSFLIVLILVVISNTFIYFALRIITKTKYDQRKLILPSLISILILFLLIYIYLKLIIHMYSIDLIDYIMKIAFKVPVTSIDFKFILLVFIGFLVMGFILESFTLLLVNVNYSKIWHNISKVFRIVINKISRKEIIKEKTNLNETSISTQDKENKLTYLNSLIASFFILSFIFFSIIALYSLGIVLSGKIRV